MGDGQGNFVYCFVLGSDSREDGMIHDYEGMRSVITRRLIWWLRGMMYR